MTRNKIWIIPFLCGILMIIGILTPSAGFSFGNTIGIYFWLWGLIYVYQNYPEHISIVEMTNDSDLLGLSLGCTFILLFCTLLFFLIAYYMKRGLRVGKLTAFNVAVIFFTTIIYIGGIGAILSEMIISEDSYIGFWDVFNPNFAIICPFIVIGLGIFGTIYYNYILISIFLFLILIRNIFSL